MQGVTTSLNTPLITQTSAAVWMFSRGQVDGFPVSARVWKHGGKGRVEEKNLVTEHASVCQTQGAVRAGKLNWNRTLSPGKRLSEPTPS